MQNGTPVIGLRIFLDRCSRSYAQNPCTAGVNDVLYAVSSVDDELYRVNVATGAATLIGPLNGIQLPEGLAYHNGVMYAVDARNNSFFSINIATGQATRIGAVGALGVRINSLASHNGVLYGTSSVRGTQGLYSINTADGVATLHGNLFAFRSGGAYDVILGLASHNGTLYGVGHVSNSALSCIFRFDNNLTLFGDGLCQITSRMQGIASFDGNLYTAGEDHNLYRVDLSPLGFANTSFTLIGAMGVQHTLGLFGTKNNYYAACYNTFNTCQDRQNYALGDSNGYSFISEDVVLDGWYSAIQRRGGFSHRAPALKYDYKMWERERMVIRISDNYFADTPRDDPYIAHRIIDTSRPRSAWMARLFARNTHFNRRRANVLLGVWRDGVVDWHTVHRLFIDRASYDNGTAIFELTDGIKIRAEDGAQCPVPSDVILKNDVHSERPDDNEWDEFALPNGWTTFEVSGGGTQTFPAGTSKISIGREIMDLDFIWTANGKRYIRVVRGTGGSEISSHENGDTVQQCYVVTSRNCLQVVRDLLTNFADIGEAEIDDESFGEFELRPDAQATSDPLLLGFNVTSIVAKPTGVDKLIENIQQSCVFNIWCDSAAGDINMSRALIKARSIVGLEVNLGPEGTRKLLDDDDIIRDSAKSTDLPREAISDVLIFCEPVSFADTSSDDSNYKLLVLERDSHLESDFARGERKTMRLYSRWANGTIARVAASRYLRSGSENAGEIVLDVNVEVDDIELGDNLRILTRRHCGADGYPVEYLARVMRIETAADMVTKRIYGRRTVYGSADTVYFRIGVSRIGGTDVIL